MITTGRESYGFWRTNKSEGEALDRVVHTPQRDAK